MTSRRGVDVLGPDNRWQHSYVFGDKTFGVSAAVDGGILRGQVDWSGLSGTKI